MTLEFYQLSSWHPDPEWHLQPFDPDPTYCHPSSPSYDPDYDLFDQICIRTQHSINMPECVARLLHNQEVSEELSDYDLGVKPKENYEIHRVDDDYEVPF